MAFMLKMRSSIKPGRRADYEKAAGQMCAAMQDYPGVICYHIDYPSELIAEWTEIYADDAVFRQHFKHPQALAAVPDLMDAGAGDTVCRCWGELNEASRAILDKHGTIYCDTGPGSFVLNQHVKM